jgi:DNA mismatch endonuclease (patch repair protein)
MLPVRKVVRQQIRPVRAVKSAHTPAEAHSALRATVEWMARRTPVPLSEEVSARMAGYRQRDTKPELRLRSALHRQGLRFYVDRAPLPAMRRRADVVFPRTRVAIYVHGCFWHGCPEHGSWPKNNARWWREKIQATQARDRDTVETLRRVEWAVVEVWEHERPHEAAQRIAKLVRSRRKELA